MRRSIVAVGAALAVLIAARAGAGEQPSLTFFWHAGDRAAALLEISHQYTEETGVTINAVLPPLSDAYHRRIAEEFAKHGSAFDLVIFDSQSMSEFASAGHVVRLNDRLEKSRAVRASDFDPAALRRYAEYPEGSGSFYALPLNQDCMGLVYRADLLEDPQEQAAFTKRYGYTLAVPQTWQELRDIAEHFTRPQDGLYGLAVYGSGDYDACTSAFNNVFWSFGAELWDPATRRASGRIDSADAVRALEFFKALFAFAPPGFENAFVPQVNGALAQGAAALGVQWYYYFDELAAATRGTGRRLGFAPLPGERDAEGRLRRFVMVGGQGISISSYSVNQEEAWKYLEWLMSPPQQWRWAQIGGKTGLASILKDPKFRDASAANRTFAESMSLTRDYWHQPEYSQLLAVYQRAVHDAVAGAVSPAEALSRCAAGQDAILH